MFLYGVSCLLVLFLLFVIILLWVGVRFGEVQSSSMVPNINVGDIVIWKNVRDISKGDVVVYRKDGRLVVHRIVNFSGNWLVVRGDSERSDLSVVSMSDLCGKVKTWCPKSRLIMVLFGTTIIGGFVLASVCLLIKVKRGG